MSEANHETDGEVMERARKIVRKKHDLFINVICYIATNVMLTFLWFITGIEFFWPIFSMIGWGFGLAVIAIDALRFINSIGYSDEIEQEYQKLKRYSKHQQ